MPEIQFDRYYRYDELTSALLGLYEAHEDLLSMESIGKSHEGRDIWLITATDSSTGPASEKPAFWVDGNIHATEVSASSAALHLLNALATGIGNDEQITHLLRTRAVYVVPRVNPDGAELALARPPKWIRSSTRPYPYDEDPIEGLSHEDVDGDGRLLSMRIPDPNGAWKTHPDDSRLMIRRDAVDFGGVYYRMLPEGRIKNYDGHTIDLQRPREGLDMNRNFPAQWRPEGEQYGAGEYPASEPEVRALIDFIVHHPNITGAVTFHTFSGLLLRPYGTKADDTMPVEDLWTFKKIGDKGTEITGYPNISVFHDFMYHPKEVFTGAFDEWMYDHLGVYAWTTEIWSPQRQAGITDYKYIDWFRDHATSDDLKMIKWNDEKLGGHGFVEWREFDHPELGKIEIGGWDFAHCFRNPPPDYLESEIAPLSDWVIWQTLISPRLEILSSEVTVLGDAVFQIQVVAQNTGWLPTYVTKRALERKIVRPVIAEIDLPEGATMVQGKCRDEFGQLEGRCYKNASGFGPSADPTDDRVKIQWTVKAPTGGVCKITLRHQRAGTARCEVTIG
jgi:murein tripeptide amidase MpaA